MIDHLSLPVSDVDASCRTWAKALAPLGYSVLMRFTKEQIPQLPYAQTAGLGTKGKPDLWLRPARQQVDYNHVAFVAQTRGEVPVLNLGEEGGELGRLRSGGEHEDVRALGLDDLDPGLGEDLA